MGGRSLLNLERFAFSGELHLVSRTSKEVHGRRCLGSVDELPTGVDAVIIAVPRQAVLPTMEACARRSIGSAIIYAAGFAETGAEGRAEQARLTAIARDAGIAVLGPNTLGMTNYVDFVCLAFGPNSPAPPVGRPALAVIAQSGAMIGSLRLSAQARKYAVSYAIATGNEAVTGVEDSLAHIVDDVVTRAIAIFAEQLRRPGEFLALARRAHATVNQSCSFTLGAVRTPAHRPPPIPAPCPAIMMSCAPLWRVRRWLPSKRWKSCSTVPNA